jgi:hypothetical protein
VKEMAMHQDKYDGNWIPGDAGPFSKPEHPGWWLERMSRPLRPGDDQPWWTDPQLERGAVYPRLTPEEFLSGFNERHAAQLRLVPGVRVGVRLVMIGSPVIKEVDPV